MARRDLPPAGPLDGTESLILSQRGRARKGSVGLDCDYTIAGVQTALTVALTAALTPILTPLSALEGADAAQAARD